MSIDASKLWEQYIEDADWKVKENSNNIKNFGGAQKYLVGHINKEIWKSKFGEDIFKYHESGDLHIHDLTSGVCNYCFGGSLETLLMNGIQGIPNLANSSPARHLHSLCSQISSQILGFAGEIAGAVAYTSFPLFAAPLWVKDGMDIQNLRQCLQSLVFNLNQNTRASSEPCFSNLTLDIAVPKPMKDKPVIIGGVTQDSTYGDYENEAKIIAKELVKILIAGDAKGVPFAYPLVTVNVSKPEDLDTELGDLVCELSAKNGNPYFANFVKSSLSSDDTYSLCCRLRLNKAEIVKKQGLFGGQPSTGSVGVVTLSLPKIAVDADGDVEKFNSRVLELMEIASEALKIKRREVTSMFDAGLYPMLKTSLPRGFNTFFNTIGYVGFNEACLELFGKPIQECKQFVQDTLDMMVDKTVEFQENSEDLYNVEASPAESAAYSLAIKMGGKYKYFTNSCHIPVDQLTNIKEAAEFYDSVLSKNSGGSVWHVFNQQSTTKQAVKSLIKTTFQISDVPYLSFTPTYYVCPEHGMLETGVCICPDCGVEGVKYTRVTGYVRPVRNFNEGKKAEEADRHNFNL